MTDEQRPKVGVGVMIFKDGKVLLGKRISSHGVNEYSFPGGHVEYLESFEDCVRREVREECGLEIQNIQFVCVSNIVDYKPKHFITLSFSAEWESGEPHVLEPEKCENWDWYSLTDLPDPIFSFSQKVIEAYQTGKNYFDIESR